MSNRFHVFWETADRWQHFAFYAIVFAATVQTAYILVYGSRPWRQHFVGRALFYKSASLLIVLWLTVVNTFFVYPGQEPISTVALWLVAAAITYQFAALLRTPRHADHPDGRHDEEHPE